jgi:hypothetical protein
MAADSSSLFLICVRGLSSLVTALLALARHAVHLPAPLQEMSGREKAGTLSRPARTARANR